MQCAYRCQNLFVPRPDQARPDQTLPSNHNLANGQWSCCSCCRLQLGRHFVYLCRWAGAKPATGQKVRQPKAPHTHTHMHTLYFIALMLVATVRISVWLCVCVCACLCVSNSVCVCLSSGKHLYDAVSSSATLCLAFVDRARCSSRTAPIFLLRFGSGLPHDHATLALYAICKLQMSLNEQLAKCCSCSGCCCCCSCCCCRCCLASMSCHCCLAPMHCTCRPHLWLRLWAANQMNVACGICKVLR